MKKYKEADKQNKLRAIMYNRTQVSFKVLEELERDGIIEDYDLFRMIRYYFDDLYVFYLDGDFYVINKDGTDFKGADRVLMQNQHFVLNRCITNPIQGFLQKKGLKVFNELSTKEFLQIMLMQKDSLLNLDEGR